MGELAYQGRVLWVQVHEFSVWFLGITCQAASEMLTSCRLLTSILGARPFLYIGKHRWCGMRARGGAEGRLPVAKAPKTTVTRIMIDREYVGYQTDTGFLGSDGPMQSNAPRGQHRPVAVKRQRNDMRWKMGCTPIRIGAMACRSETATRGRGGSATPWARPNTIPDGRDRNPESCRWACAGEFRDHDQHNITSATIVA